MSQQERSVAPDSSAAQRDTAPEVLSAPESAQPSDGPAADEFYVEDGFLVFTAAYHLRRGYCCNSGCRHCPYGHPEAS